MGPTPDNEAVLEIKDLQISYETRWGDVPAVRGVDFKVRKGETLGIVGESGCGKSTISYGILNFLGRNGKVTGGSIKFMGQEMVGLSKSEFEKIRGNQISMVYQDPMQALNPSLTIGTQLAEVLITHQRIPPKTAWEKCINMLKRVYMPDPGNVMNRFPHMISGGQQQRVVIAMALLNNPKLLIMDEPTTALDVTVEAAVLDLVEDLKKDFNTGIIFITHNLGVVARISNSLCVMYAGEMVEKGPIETIFKTRHTLTPAGFCAVCPGCRMTCPSQDSGPSEAGYRIRGSDPQPHASLLPGVTGKFPGVIQSIHSLSVSREAWITGPDVSWAQIH